MLAVNSLRPFVAWTSLAVLFAAWMGTSESATAREITIYATSIAASSSNDWVDESFAEGGPGGCDSGNCCSVNDTRNSADFLEARSWQSLGLQADELITRVRVDVYARYDNPSTGNLLTMRVRNTVAQTTQNSVNWTQGSNACRWRMAGDGWDITSLKSQWTAADIVDLWVAVRRRPTSTAGTTCRVNSLKIIVDTITCAPSFTLSTTSLAFGQLCGRGIQPELSVTATNSNPQCSLSIAPTLSGGPFTITQGGTSGSIGPGQSRSIRVRFDTDVAFYGAHSTTLSLGNGQTVSVTGTVLDDTLQLTHATVSGRTLCSSDVPPAVSWTIYLRNDGDCPASLNIQTGDPRFVLTDGGGIVVLGPGVDHDVTIEFDGSGLAEGIYSTTLQFAPSESIPIEVGVFDPTTTPEYEIVEYWCWWYFDEFEGYWREECDDRSYVGPPQTIEWTIDLQEVIQPSGPTAPEPHSLIVRTDHACHMDCTPSVTGAGFSITTPQPDSIGGWSFDVSWSPDSCPGIDLGSVELCGGVSIPLQGTVLDGTGQFDLVTAVEGPFAPAGCGAPSTVSVEIQNASPTCTISGTAALSQSEANFLILSGEGPYTLPPLGTRTVVIKFDPKCDLGPPDRSASLDYGHGLPLFLNAPIDFDVTPQFDPDRWDVSVYVANGPQTVETSLTLRNTTPWTQTVSALPLSTDFFELVSPPQSLVLASDDSTEVLIRWNYPGGGELTDVGSMSFDCATEFGLLTTSVPLNGRAVDGDTHWVVEDPTGFLGVARISPSDVIQATMSLCNDGPIPVTRVVDVSLGDIVLVGGAREIEVPGEGCVDVTVAFQPTSTGWTETYLTAQRTDGQDYSSLKLSAFGGPYLAEPAVVSFGQKFTYESETRDVVLRAPKLAPLSLAVDEFPCAPFEYLGPLSIQLPAGTSTSLSFRYSGTTADEYASVLAFAEPGSTPLPLFVVTEAATPAPPADPSPSGIRLVVSPTPSAGPISIQLRGGATASERGHVEIYDVRGRRVARSQLGIVSGEATWVWDGRDRTGSPVAAGVYLVRVRVAGQSLSKSVVLR